MSTKRPLANSHHRQDTGTLKWVVVFSFPQNGGQLQHRPPSHFAHRQYWVLIYELCSGQFSDPSWVFFWSMGKLPTVCRGVESGRPHRALRHRSLPPWHNPNFGRGGGGKYGCGSNHHLGSAGFSPCFHFPGFQSGCLCLTHNHISFFGMLPMAHCNPQ